MGKRENADKRRTRRQQRKEKVKRQEDKAEAKLSKKQQREKQRMEEEDLDALIAQFQEKDRMLTEVVETKCDHPSPRSACSLVTASSGSDIILYGGEYTNGLKTTIYPDLFFYNIKKNTWKNVSIPQSPPPRSGHQAVMVPRAGGQMWVFGGEYASPGGTNFRHYKDLWVLHMSDKKWEKIGSKNAPSPRSGHRMCVVDRLLCIFGGFHDDAKKAPKYFNDVHIFDLDAYKWDKLSFTPLEPQPEARSACQISALEDGFIVFGGYSIARVKGDVTKGITHDDMWQLTCEDNDEAAELYAKVLAGEQVKKTPKQGAFAAGKKWSWTRIRPGGSVPPARCSASSATTTTGTVVSFGGVNNNETEETLSGDFFNDLHKLNPKTMNWSKVAENIEGRQGSSSPCPRMSSMLTFKGNVLYIFGGIVEKGDKQTTFNDFYSVDISKKTLTWTVLHEPDERAMEWLDDTSSDEDGDDNDGSQDGKGGDEDGDSKSKQKKKKKRSGKAKQGGNDDDDDDDDDSGDSA